MSKKVNKDSYEWSYCSFGGVVRVNIRTGEDIAHLGELDRKLWTVLSCPTQGLEFPADTLRMLDADADGKIRVDEVIAASGWLCSVLKNKELLIQAPASFKLSEIDTSSEAGAKLHASALQILANLGLEKDEIGVADTSDGPAIFAGTPFNGDGVITNYSTSDAALQEVIAAIASTVGSATDRCGEQGVNADQIEAFYAALADYAAWQQEGAAAALPYKENTEAALQAALEVKDKVADYFMRCKLIAFTEEAAGALDVSVAKIGEIAGGNLVAEEAEIASYPIARPSKDCILHLDAVNPAWKARIEALRSLTGLKEAVTEKEWSELLAGFDAYTAWKAAKKGGAVESLGLDKVKALLKADNKAALLELVAKDKELEAEASSIDQVNKLTHLVRDFYKLLRNYVILSDFYSPEQDSPAVFETGRLYIDQRCCRVCIPVMDAGAHADASALSNCFLLYCVCVSKTSGKTKDIVAVMTDGSTRNLRPGKHGVFYDRDGLDYDATIVRVVENPISIKQAFWSPYIKFWNWITGLINKSAEEKDAKAMDNMKASATGAAADPAAAKQPFDIAKFAGIFAAVGMGIGLLAAALAAVVTGLAKLPWWGILLVIVGIMLLISGPSCFIAWGKLRRRNLGPVLNANGWAINSGVLISIPFGKTLTSTAKYPRLNLDDPYKPRLPWWRKLIRCIIVLAVIAFACLFFTGHLDWIGLDCINILAK